MSCSVTASFVDILVLLNFPKLRRTGTFPVVSIPYAFRHSSFDLLTSLALIERRRVFRSQLFRYVLALRFNSVRVFQFFVLFGLPVSFWFRFSHSPLSD